MDRPATGSISFASPIRDSSPPRLFVRLSSSRHGSLEVYVVINGVPGAWTGFTIYAAAQGGKTLPLYELDYVVARPSFREPASDWAFQLLDGAGKTVFCSDEVIVRFSKFTKKWVLRSATGAAGLYYNTLYSGVTIEFDDFVDVTFFNRGLVVQFAQGLMYTGIQLYSGGVRVFNLQAQCSNSLTRDASGSINFCTPICKFPVDRFPLQ